MNNAMLPGDSVAGGAWAASRSMLSRLVGVAVACAVALALTAPACVASAQFSWDGDCGINWADCCNFGTEENPDWHNNWTIAPNPTACPDLPGFEDHVNASTTVVLAQPFQTWVKSLTVTGTFMLLSELDVTDFVTINGTITEPTNFLLQNGPTVTVELHGANATASISSFATLEFQFDGSIAGPPGALLTNDGVISKTDGAAPPAESLSFLNIPVQNNGTISAWHGTIVLGMDTTNDGVIEAFGDASVQFRGPANFVLDGEVRGDGLIRFLSTFIGGATTVTGHYHPTNTLIAGGYATVNFEVKTHLENLTLDNPGVLGGSADLTIDNLMWGSPSTMTPGGITTVEDTMLIYNLTTGGAVLLQRDMELFGECVIDVNGGLAIEQAELRNFGDIEMRGNTTIAQPCCVPNAGVKNFGTLRKASGALSLINVIFSNFGEVAVESGTLQFDGEMASEGPITVDAGATLIIGHKTQTLFGSGSMTGAGTVLFQSDFADETMDDIGGLYDVSTTTIQAAQVAFDSDATTATLNMIGGFGTSRLLGDGDFIVTEQLNWSAGEMAGDGRTIVHGPMILTGGVSLDRMLELNSDAQPGEDPPAWTMFIKPLGTLHGTDVTIDGYVNNSGVIAPGTAKMPIGYLHFTGGFTQNFDGQLSIDSLGGSTHDQLLVDGLATLGGTLNASGFPAGGTQSFTILTAAAVTGEFAQVNLPAGYMIAYLRESVVLQPAPGEPCLADIVTSRTFAPPPDGIVNAADLAYLLGAWGANPGSPADMVTSATFAPPPDGVVNAADLAYLLGAWGLCE
jgi:hypothetical protein